MEYGTIFICFVVGLMAGYAIVTLAAMVARGGDNN